MENLSINEKNVNLDQDQGKIENTNAEHEDTRSLSELFDNGLTLFNEITHSTEPTKSYEIQSKVKKAMSLFEKATILVSAADMFSKNETLEEVPTEHLKYLMLPFLLGILTTNICQTKERKNLVEVSEIYFTDFLRRAQCYGVTKGEQSDKSTEKTVDTLRGSLSEQDSIMKMSLDRERKIKMYNDKRELEKKFSVLEKTMASSHIDEEQKREYFVTWLKLSVESALDEIKSLNLEKQILERSKELKIAEHSEDSKTKQKMMHAAPKLKPVIITRDSVQKQVFGAGYPSLPVLTVQEFYDQRVQSGEWPEGAQSNLSGRHEVHDANHPAESAEGGEAEAIATEKAIEDDDIDYLERMRGMDDYKDTHRRGWGNRANRS